MAYGGETDRREFSITINWVSYSIALFAVTLRLVSRRLLEKNKWEIDDAFIVLAMTVITAKTVWMTVDISNGYGRHLEALLVEDATRTMKLAASSYSLNAISLWTWTVPKLPVVALLVRLFQVYDNNLGRVLYSLLGFLFLWNSAMTIITFVQCSPVKKNWTPTVPGTCWNPRIYLDLGYFAGAYSATLDFIFAAYPIIRISKLQMDLSRRILIAASFSLGIPAGIVTLYKLSMIATLLNQNDPTFATVPLDVWNCVEYTALILAAAVPMTRPIMVLLFRRFQYLTSRISGWSSSGSGGTTKYNNDANIPDLPGINRLSRQGGYKKYKSNEEILLEETQHSENMI